MCGFARFDSFQMAANNACFGCQLYNIVCLQTLAADYKYFACCILYHGQLSRYVLYCGKMYHCSPSKMGTGKLLEQPENMLGLHAADTQVKWWQSWATRHVKTYHCNVSFAKKSSTIRSVTQYHKNQNSRLGSD